MGARNYSLQTAILEVTILGESSATQEGRTAGTANFRVGRHPLVNSSALSENLCTRREKGQCGVGSLAGVRLCEANSVLDPELVGRMLAHVPHCELVSALSGIQVLASAARAVERTSGAYAKANFALVNPS